jgi:hypothetical protein
MSSIDIVSGSSQIRQEFFKNGVAAAGVVAPQNTAYSDKIGMYFEKTYDDAGNMFSITYWNGKPMIVAKQDVITGSWSQIDLETFYTRYNIASSKICTVPILTGDMLVGKVPIPSAKTLD